MKKISIEGTSKTPCITVDLAKGFLEIKGRSIPENSTDFYMPVKDSLNDFVADKSKTLTANFRLEYFNTSSSKCILDILKNIADIKSKGSLVTINWYYEDDDDDMLESGENYQEILDLKFNMIPIPSV